MHPDSRTLPSRRTRQFALGLLALAAVAPALFSELPTGTSSLFSGSGTCVLCHQSNGSALVTSGGLDLSPTTRWRSSMMANAAKDPYWQAKVESEALAFPALKSIIEDKCTTCHAPMGRTQAVYDGADGFGMEQMRGNTLALDGVSCTACHQIQPGNLGTVESFSGGYIIDDSRVIFGPYSDPLDMPMRNVVNYASEFGAHMQSAAFCATCHTLYTPYLDDDGEIAGTFPEQTPYLEWRSSTFARDGVPCQSCHMPAVDEPVQITTIPPVAPLRSPFSQHTFVGGNAFMLQLMRTNGLDLNVTATEAQFDTTTALTRAQLGKQALELTATPSVEENQFTLTVDLVNLTGHKFPTGFPSRRVWLHVKAADQSGEIVFESGAYGPDGKIKGLDETKVEPHHDVIETADLVQIYEGRMIDVNGDPTLTLLRGAGYVKDNRIPPGGFTREAEAYEDMAIRGAAETDPDFNNAEGIEGSGTDRVTYRWGIGGLTGILDVSVSVLYQSVAPVFVEHFNAGQASGIDRFLAQYNNADKTPEIVQATALKVDLSTGTAVYIPAVPQQVGTLQPCYPNPFREMLIIPVEMGGAGAEGSLRVFDVGGRLVRVLPIDTGKEGTQMVVWDGLRNDGTTAPAGPYFVRLTVGGRSVTQLVARLR